MAWSIVEVARMAKVTSRTLRHYDDVGLLRPAFVGANGYRYYEQEQLLVLQQVLLLRELGLGLDAIAGVLAGQVDRVVALGEHQRWLLAERDRLSRLADTVAATITQLNGGQDMPAPELFEGFADRQAQAEEALVARFGDGVREHFATARERTSDWTKEDYLAAQRQAEDLDARVADLMRSGAAPDDATTLAVIAEHHRMICAHWTPDRTSYTGLGTLYVEDPELRERYEALAPGLAEYYRDAIAAYAEACLR